MLSLCLSVCLSVSLSLSLSLSLSHTHTHTHTHTQEHTFTFSSSLAPSGWITGREKRAGSRRELPGLVLLQDGFLERQKLFRVESHGHFHGGVSHLHARPLKPQHQRRAELLQSLTPLHATPASGSLAPLPHCPEAENGKNGNQPQTRSLSCRVHTRPLEKHTETHTHFDHILSEQRAVIFPSQMPLCPPELMTSAPQPVSLRNETGSCPSHVPGPGSRPSRPGLGHTALLASLSQWGRGPQLSAEKHLHRPASFALFSPFSP